MLALGLAAVMAMGSILPVFDLSQAQASAPGNLYGWGVGASGQLGNTTGDSPNVPTRLPAPPGGAADWNELDFFQGAHHTFVRTTDGRLFGWGHNDHGQLGLGPANMTHQFTPIENTNLPPGIPNWNYAEFIYGTHNTYVRTLMRNANNELVPDGRLFGWGRNNNGQAGVGSNVHVSTPTQLNNLPGMSNWNGVEIFLKGEHGGLARTPDGRLFTWGLNNTGQLGLGHENPVNAPAQNNNLPSGVASWNDVELIVTWSKALALTSDGRLFVWGQNTQGNLGLGHDNPVNVPTLNDNRPQGVANWNDVEFIPSLAFSMFVRTSDGRLFGWGQNIHGQLGIGNNDNQTNPVQNTNLPPGATNWNDVDFVHNVHHTFVITPQNRMFGWGQNDWGQLGLGHEDPVNTPTEVTNLPTGVRNWRDLEFFPSGHHHNLARVRPLPPLPITKTLRLNEGTIVPGTEMPANTPAGRVSGEATFTFRFFPQNEIRISDDPVRYSNPSVPAIADQTITIDPSTATAPAGGIFTATGNTVCIRALVYAHNPFPYGGIYVWELEELREAPNWSGLHNPPLTYMQYDSTRYQIRAHANRSGIIEVIAIYEMERNAQNNWQIVEPKLGAAPFTNTYTRMVGDNNRAALYISKYIAERDMAPIYTRFNFTATLTNPAIVPPNIGTVTAVVVNANTGVPVSPARTYTVVAGTTNNFTLAHDEKLRIPELPAGTLFSVTEEGKAQFRPQASVAGSIPVPPSTGTYPQLGVGDSLTTGTYIIHQVNINRTSFTNTHIWDVPAGLLLTSSPWAALGVVGLLLAVLAVTRNRKRIEELPLAI